MSLAQAAEMLGINRETVRLLVKKGEIRAHKKTLGRTSAFIVDQDSVLDFDSRRRAQIGAQGG
jgi:excisionase family DNA binding protein